MTFLRKEKGFSQQKIADKLGVKPNSISNYEKGVSTPDYSILIALSKILNISIDDLLGKNLSGFEKQQLKKPNTGYKAIQPVAVTVDESGEDNIVMVDRAVSAGYPQHYADPAFFHDLPAFKLPGPEFRRATFRSFQVEGDSMSDTIYHSDWVIAKYVEHYNHVKEGYIHVIVTEDSLQVKRLLNRVQERGKLVLLSDNRNYPSEEVDISNIYELWYVKAKLSFNLPNRNEGLANKVAYLEADMHEMKRTIHSLNNPEK